MRKLAQWLKRVWPSSAPSRDEDLPFSPEEFARLIKSGKADDMRTLAAGLTAPHRMRRPAAAVDAQR